MQDNRGDTALTWAARKGNLEIAEALVDAGADLDLQNKKGDTALILAAIRGDKTAVSMLLKSGADTEIRNGNGQSARDVATGGAAELLR